MVNHSPILITYHQFALSFGKQFPFIAANRYKSCISVVIPIFRIRSARLWIRPDVLVRRALRHSQSMNEGRCSRCVRICTLLPHFLHVDTQKKTFVLLNAPVDLYRRPPAVIIKTHSQCSYSTPSVLFVSTLLHL